MKAQEKKYDLIIGGDSAFAEIAFEYFEHDSEYRVVAFTVERAYLKRDTLFSRPVIPFEELHERYPPSRHHFYAALTYAQLNRLRARFVESAKKRGYPLASYVSSAAFVWRNVTFGEHCFIFENNVVQPFVKVGSNVVMWSGNHIGHHSTIADNCFISSHVVVSGFCNVGPNCFLGVNATIANNVDIGADCLVGAGAVVLKNTPENRLLGARSTEPHPKTAREYFRVPD